MKKARSQYRYSLIIRQATIQDISDLVGLLRELFSVEKDFEFNPGKQKKGLDLLISRPVTPSRILVACDKGRCIGMVTAQIVVSTAEGAKSALIEDMVVLKDYRGNGIGSRLLSAMESWCRGCGISRMQLLADKNNPAAARFYKKKGWNRTQLVGYRKHTRIKR